VCNLGFNLFREPDFSTVSSGSRVLAKYSDGLWYRATVSSKLYESLMNLACRNRNLVQDYFKNTRN
jgi:hypothetical protein